jgi:hypothetical protein
MVASVRSDIILPEVRAPLVAPLPKVVLSRQGCDHF